MFVGAGGGAVDGELGCVLVVVGGGAIGRAEPAGGVREQSSFVLS